MLSNGQSVSNLYCTVFSEWPNSDHDLLYDLIYILEVGHQGFYLMLIIALMFDELLYKTIGL